MNTVKSVYYGWGVLIGAGGLAYYLAKRSISADRAIKALDDVEWRKKQDQMRLNEREYRDYMLTKSKGTREMKGGSGRDGSSASEPAAQDATSRSVSSGQTQAGDRQRTLERSKYEAREVFKAPKGDRFTFNIFGSPKKD